MTVVTDTLAKSVRQTAALPERVGSRNDIYLLFLRTVLPDRDAKISYFHRPQVVGNPKICDRDSCGASFMLPSDHRSPCMRQIQLAVLVCQTSKSSPTVEVRQTSDINCSCVVRESEDMWPSLQPAPPAAALCDGLSLQCVNVY